MSLPFADELALAQRLADAADAFTLPRHQAADFTLGWKDNRTEVTEIDRETETLMGDMLVKERPDHGYFGEEHGLIGDEDSDWRWIVDPIDGTSGFVRGMPIWATLIALTRRPAGSDVFSDVVVAVASAPALQRRWWATLGGGSYVDGRKIEVSEVADPEMGQLNITFTPSWQALGKGTALAEMMFTGRRGRSVGDFWQHCLVAEGCLDLAVEGIGVEPYDLAAVSLIVREAGGMFTDRHGNETYLNDSAISSNGHLHQYALGKLAD